MMTTSTLSSPVVQQTDYGAGSWLLIVFFLKIPSTLSSVGRAACLYRVGPWFEPRRVDKVFKKLYERYVGSSPTARTMNKKAYIKRFDKSLPLPEYKTPGAAGFDLCARIEVRIDPKTVGYVPMNVAIEPPEGHFMLFAARSSLHKKGFMVVNGVGVGDRDFSGNNDEYAAALYNFTDAPIVIKVGDRIMQGVFIPHTHITWEEVDDMGNKSRGGFGTTGER